MQVDRLSGQGAQVTAMSTGASVSDTPFSEALAAAQDAVIHTVQRGETLSHIVKTQLSTSGQPPNRAEIYAAVQEVAAANSLVNANLIHPGQVLDLGVLVSRKPTATREAAPAAPKENQAAATALPAMMPLMKAATVPPVAAISPGAAAVSTSATASNPRAMDSFKATRAQYFSRRSDWASYPNSQPLGGPSNNRDEPVWFELTAQVSMLDPLLAGSMPQLAKTTRAIAPEAPETAAAHVTTGPWAPVIDVPGRITSAYGDRTDPFTGRPDFHSGVDIAAEFGARIRPVRDGVVTFSGWQPGYGKVVVVRHGNGIDTVYGHNAVNLVKAGDRVNAESVLGLLGNTGRSTGPHLHFEVRENGSAVDPMPYLQREQVAAR